MSDDKGKEGSTDPLEYMLGKADAEPTSDEHKNFRKLVENEAAHLAGKSRETVMRRIEVLERDEHVKEDVGMLRFQIKTRILDEISNITREKKRHDGSGHHEGHGH